MRCMQQTLTRVWMERSAMPSCRLELVTETGKTSTSMPCLESSQLRWKWIEKNRPSTAWVNCVRVCVVCAGNVLNCVSNSANDSLSLSLWPVTWASQCLMRPHSLCRWHCWTSMTMSLSSSNHQWEWNSLNSPNVAVCTLELTLNCVCVYLSVAACLTRSWQSPSTPVLVP